MSYTGEFLNQYGVIEIDCSRISVVVVSGDRPNICGHMLIATGFGRNAYYFYVADWTKYPRYMTESGFQRFLRETGKTEIRRLNLPLPNPQGAKLYLEKLLANKWIWGGLPNNCVTFVEEVIRAGGGNWSSYSNCPRLATQDIIQTKVYEFLNYFFYIPRL